MSQFPIAKTFTCAVCACTRDVPEKHRKVLFNMVSLSVFVCGECKAMWDGVNRLLVDDKSVWFVV